MKQIKIQLTKEQQDDINNGAEVVLVPFHKKYSLTERTWYISFYGEPSKSVSATERHVASGMYRKVKEDAKRLSERRIKSERLSALACELGVERDFTKRDEKGSNYYIIFDVLKKLYITVNAIDWNTIGVPYMTKEGANDICEMLNNGEFEL